METTNVDISLIREARKKQCVEECRHLATWLLDRANLMDQSITDTENTILALQKRVGQMNGRIDNAGWSATFPVHLKSNP
tara:strand:+ start:110 stop:349 length:240 start_codon:yes stop_codon:yes gene_type:complete